jgi:uncharacterized membrane protein YobD (UPF0266 family)
MTSVFPLFVTVFVAAFFFGAAGFFFTDTIFFTGAAFFAAKRDTAVGFFLVTVTVFFLAAAARGAFFAALFFAFVTAFAMNLHHNGLFLPETEKRPHYWNIASAPTYTLWILHPDKDKPA